MKHFSFIPGSSTHSTVQEQKTFLDDTSRKNEEMRQEILDWKVEVPQERLLERYPLMRQIPYTFSIVTETNGGNSPGKAIPVIEEKEGSALSLNLHSKGMLLLLDQKVEVGQVLKIGVPTPFSEINTPTLAEVQWIKKLPFPSKSSALFVGIKFLV